MRLAYLAAVLVLAGCGDGVKKVDRYEIMLGSKPATLGIAYDSKGVRSYWMKFKDADSSIMSINSRSLLSGYEDSDKDGIPDALAIIVKCKSPEYNDNSHDGITYTSFSRSKGDWLPESGFGCSLPDEGPALAKKLEETVREISARH